MKSQLTARDAQRLRNMVEEFADELRSAESSAMISAEYRAVSVLSDMGPFPNAIRAEAYEEMAISALREEKKRRKKAQLTQLAIYKELEKLSTTKEA